MTGSYVYTDVGRSIPLSGKVDPSGALVLSEGAPGKVTGTLRLHPVTDGLAGEWSSTKGDKVFPLRLSPGAAWGGSRADAGGGPERQAEACLADPSCPAADADRLFVVAADAHAPGLDCYRFLDGAGTKRDAARGRACLEREVGTSTCEGGSAGLDRAELAVLLIDGVGGAVDIARGRALFDGCMSDVTATGVLGHAAAREHDPTAAAAKFCGDIGGTTLTSNECLSRGLMLDDTRMALAEKRVAAGLDAAAVKSLVEASQAYLAYAKAMGGFAYETYIDGSIRNAMFIGREAELYQARTKELEGFVARYQAPETTPEDVSRAEKRAAAALAAVTTSTTGEKTALAETQTTWVTYRDTELKFEVQAYGPKLGAERVERGARARLEAKRATECAVPPMEGH